MKYNKFLLPLLFIGGISFSLLGCGNSNFSNQSSGGDYSSGGGSKSSSHSNSNSSSASSGGLSTLNGEGWSYDSSNNVYYQLGLVYCDNPATTDYESLGIYIPGDYVNATKSGSTYTISSFTTTAVNGFTAATAPIVIPVNTPGYSQQTAPTSYKYSTVGEYMEAGFVYVYAGCRGRQNGSSYAGGAPWGVTDLKAAIRYIRYFDDYIPGNKDRIFTFGHSGGGAQSSLLGATGDSELYETYLNDIGALMTDADGNKISDAVCGSMCWCPITSLDIADSAYEWMMGQFASSGTRSSSKWTSALSDDLAEYYATYINSMGFTSNGTALKLESSSDGIYLSGTYYEYLLDVIEESLNNYLSDNYSSTSNKASYVSSLSSSWVSYDSSSDYATISDLGGFVDDIKSATKDVGAFDDLDLGQAENQLFGTSSSDYLHFDQIMADLLKANQSAYSSYSDFDSDYVSDYADDMDNNDDLNVKSSVRQNMYNPLYYIHSGCDGYGDSTVAPYWRIRTGITQGDTSLTTEMNLALALEMNSTVKDVDFATVWAKGHTQAERTGDGDSNFIEWIEDIFA